MDADVRAALERDLTIDITTTGRRSGQPRRIEIWFYNVDGRIYLGGSSGDVTGSVPECLLSSPLADRLTETLAGMRASAWS